jgi:hypothetical protein
VGFVALFIDSLEGLVTWALDGLASLAFLAGGLVCHNPRVYIHIYKLNSHILQAYAITLRGTDCSDPTTTWNNVLLSGGCVTMTHGQQDCFYADTDPGKLNSRCSSAKADSAFMFIDFVVCIAIIACSFFLSGNRGSYRGGIV